MSVLITCPYCEVRYEVDEDKTETQCPICQQKAKIKNRKIKKQESSLDITLVKADNIKNKKNKQQKHELSLRDKLLKKRWKQVLLVSSFVFFFIPLVLVLGIDFTLYQRLTWSVLVALCLVFVWVSFSIVILFYPNRLVIMSLLFASSVIVFLMLFNRVLGTQWFGVLGFLISVLWLLCLVITALVGKKLNKRGVFYTGAIFLFTSLIALVLTESLLDFYLYAEIQLTWSLIATGAVIPLVFLLVYLHKHRALWQRWFYL